MKCDLFLSVGTSSVVQPAASLIDLARAARVVTIEVNPIKSGQTGWITADFLPNQNELILRPLAPHTALSQ